MHVHTCVRNTWIFNMHTCAHVCVRSSRHSCPCTCARAPASLQRRSSSCTCTYMHIHAHTCTGCITLQQLVGHICQWPRRVHAPCFRNHRSCSGDLHVCVCMCVCIYILIVSIKHAIQASYACMRIRVRHWPSYMCINDLYTHVHYIYRIHAHKCTALLYFFTHMHYKHPHACNDLYIHVATLHMHTLYIPHTCTRMYMTDPDTARSHLLRTTPRMCRTGSE